jgi:hypothetical protein
VRALIVVMVLVMTCALAAQVSLRYGVNITLSWSEELSLGLFTWTDAAGSSALGVREGYPRAHGAGAGHRCPSGPAPRIRTVDPPGHRVRSACSWPGPGWRYVADTRGCGVGGDRLPDRTAARVSAFVCGVLIAVYCARVGAGRQGCRRRPAPIDPDHV